MRRRIAASCMALALLCGCGGADAAPETENAGRRSMELRYAEQFAVEYDTAGRALITIAGTDRFWVVPRDAEVPEDAGAAPILRVPLENAYVAATSAMDFFSRLDALDAVRFTGTDADGWSLKPVRLAMEAGNILYAGKYSAPDFERLLTGNCSLAIESTMIFHSPDIREQLETLGIPVLVERSSYEPHPLGRMEWVKLYGLLTGQEAEAAAFFDQQAERAERVAAGERTGKTAAWFSLSPGGSVSVRKPGDYAVKMLDMAGGDYALSHILPEEDNALSSVKLQLEVFYTAAKDADVLIYNGTIDGGVETVAQLVDRCEPLADFKAVQAGNVWCTERNLFQEPTAVADMVSDLRAVLSGTADGELTYLRRLS